MGYGMFLVIGVRYDLYVIEKDAHPSRTGLCLQGALALALVLALQFPQS